MFFLGFLDSVGVPLPAVVDLLVITISLKAPQRAYLTALLTTLGSVAGNLTLFLAVRHGSRLFRKNVQKPEERSGLRKWWDRYGMLTVFVPAATPFVPLPLKVFVVLASVFHVPAGEFLGVIAVARFIRYFGCAYLAVRLGQDAQGFLQRNAWTILGVVIGAALGFYILTRSLDRRGNQSRL
jgi:membrane protein YqaA with SNARE-associated domain